MRVNLNKRPCTANFAAKPPPLPITIKAAAATTVTAEAAAIETAIRKFDHTDWEDFLTHYWAHFDPNEHAFRDNLPSTSIGLRTAGDVAQLMQNGRKY